MEAGEYAGLLNNGFCKICCLIKRRVAGMIAIEISGELRRLIVVMGSILGLLLLLSGCGSGSQTSRHISQPPVPPTKEARQRSEEHTSELQSLMRNSYDHFCLKKKNKHSDSERNTCYHA